MKKILMHFTKRLRLRRQSLESENVKPKRPQHPVRTTEQFFSLGINGNQLELVVVTCISHTKLRHECFRENASNLFMGSSKPYVYQLLTLIWRKKTLWKFWKWFIFMYLFHSFQTYCYNHYMYDTYALLYFQQRDLESINVLRNLEQD